MSISLLLGLLFTIHGCTIPEAPGTLSWNSHLYVPFGTSTYRLSQLADTSTTEQSQGSGVGIDTSADQAYFFSYTDLKVPLTTALSVSPFSGSMRKPAGMTDTTALFLLPTMQHRLLSATIARGSVAFTVQNLSPVTGDTAEATFLNFRYHSGDTLVLRVFVPAHGRFDTTINLAGDYMNLEDLTPQQTRIRLRSSAAVELVADFHTSEFTFNAYTGILDNLVLTADPHGIDVVRPPEGWDAIHPTEVNARIHLVGGYIGATASTSIHVVSHLNGGSIGSRDLAVNNINMGRDTTVVIQGLAALLADYPDSVSASGSMTMSGRLTTHGEDTVYVTVGLRAPLSFTLRPFHAPDSARRIDPGQLDDVESGTATVRIWNRLPVGGRVYLVAARDSVAVLENSHQWADTLARAVIPQPPIANGYAATESYTQFTVSLDDSLLSWLAHPPFFARTDVRVDGSDGDTLIARASDYVKVQITADIQYHVSTEDQP